MRPFPCFLALVALLNLAALNGLAQAQLSAVAPAGENYSEEAIALQGVWTIPDDEESPVAMARLIVHGTYLLLIYQFEGEEANEIEIRGFRADDRIRYRDGDPAFDYEIIDDRRVHLEIRDERPDPDSARVDLPLVRTGRFPDLGLGEGNR